MSQAQKSLAILEALLASARDTEFRGVSREVRSETLLREHNKPAIDWYMYVDERFNTALSIERTIRVTSAGKDKIWTQGTGFSFSAGDKIYDTREAYGLWSPTRIRRCFSVISAYPASSATRQTAEGQILAGYRGEVTFEVWAPSSCGTRLEPNAVTQRMTQDDFVRLLIVGPKT